MNKPFFSVIIPTYNRADFIGRTIKSVLNQDFKNFELIVVDDGSTDHTAQVVEGFDDERIRYYYKTNAERGAARNFGALKSKGEYLNFLDSDDLLYENHLSSANDIVQAEKLFLFSLHYDLSIKGEINNADYLPKRRIINELLIKKGNFLSCNAVFLHKQVFKENMFSENRALSGSEDYELWLRLASRNSFYFFPLITSTIVFHNDRSVIQMSAKKIIKRKEIMLSSLFDDQAFVEKYEGLKDCLLSNTYSYIALHLSLLGKKKEALKYLFLSLKARPLSFIKRRTLAIIKHLLG